MLCLGVTCQERARAVMDDTPPMEDHDPFGELERQLCVPLDQDHGHAPLLAQLLEHTKATSTTERPIQYAGLMSDG